MCGFVGAFNTDISCEEISVALNVLGYRGPDCRQVKQIDTLALGSCRLAILPPLDSPPICSPSDQQVLVLNGEIYGLGINYENPKSAFPKTDTEFMGQLLKERGTRLLPDLNGLFSLCFFDGNSLILARDRFGIKPLYYANHRGGLVFASEMKVLLSLHGFSRELDEDVMSSFSVLGYNIFVGKTPFRAISAVQPGHFVEVQSFGVIKELLFAQVPKVPQPGQGSHPDPEELRDVVENLLTTSVKRAVLHDLNPKALFFSGGLDSSLLLDIARKEIPVTAFILSDREDTDDLVEARKIATTLDVPLQERLINESDLAREIVHYAWHFEHPIAGGTFDLLGGVAFHALARNVGSDFRVALCGEGADELFLGYHRLHMEPNLFIETMKERAESHATPALREWLEVHNLLHPNSGGNHAIRDLALHQGLSEYHLPSVDRSGMAFGLEIRPPYLDNELVDYVARLDEASLIDRTHNWTKMPLRSIARRRFTEPGMERVAVRRKRAMPSAVEMAAAQLLEKLPNDKNGKKKPDYLQSLLAELFIYLHVEPGFSTPPDFSIYDFAAEVNKQVIAS
ncbi:MAG: hypothetical protein HY739_02150 [Desulfobacterales bacterium]|nr:hypothetical protein [Desulfobacterales bacterium]